MKPTALVSAAALMGSTLFACALPAFAPPAFAQAPPDGAPAPQDPMQRRAMGMHRREEMAADVHTILHIRPDQEQAFQTFMAALHRPRLPPQSDAAGAPPPPIAPDEEAAYQSFSAVLTPDQQQVLAALRRLALDRPHWGGRGMHRGMGGEGGEPQ